MRERQSLPARKTRPLAGRSPFRLRPTLPPRLMRNATDAQKAAHEAALATFNGSKRLHIERMQNMPRFADRIAAELAALQAKADAKKTAAAVAAAPSVAIGNLLD